MPFQRSTLLTAAALMLGTFTVDHEAQAALLNVAAGKTYAYYGAVPGEGSYYQDNGHVVHAANGGLGVFSTGQLTDGLVQTGEPLRQADLPSSPDVSYLGTMGRIVIDLGGLFSIDSISIGTNRMASLANFRPENVNLLFSSVGVTSGDFGAPIQWDIPTDTSDGQVTFKLNLASVVNARYVQFDFATPGQPTTEIHFDELSVFGSAVTTHPAPEPGTLLLAGAGLLGAASRRRTAG